MSTRVDATDFLVLDEAAALHEVLTRGGYSLRPKAACTYYKAARRLTVRLVWRDRMDGSVVLTLRVQNGK